MSYGLSKFIKNLLPRGLFYRTLLIVAVPIIVLQLVITIVFFDSLWIKTNKGMTRALVGEIKTFIEAYNNDEYNNNDLSGLFSISDFCLRSFGEVFWRFLNCFSDSSRSICRTNFWPGF